MTGDGQIAHQRDGQIAHQRDGQIAHLTGTAAAIAVYQDHAPGLIARYETIPPAEWYAPVAGYLPGVAVRVADIGAGTGRDAGWFAGLGHDVTAVEPVAAFRAVRPDLRWVADALPDLPVLTAMGARFDLITLSAVWHHLNDAERDRAGPVLRRLLAAGGRMIVALRHGPGAAGRPVWAVPVADEVARLERVGFRVVFQTAVPSIMPGNIAPGVTWDWLVVEGT